jgi:cysteine desulfurase
MDSVDTVRHIYLDHNATTRPRDEVRAAMDEALGGTYGNPSSPHQAGRSARTLVERARGEVARLIGAAADEVVFTSGGTESDNLGVRGAAWQMRRRNGRRTVVSSPLEHPAVKGSLEALTEEGFILRHVPVDGEGRIDPQDLGDLLDGDTALVSLALANHELGNLYPVAEFARRCHHAGALLHCDAVQAAGKVALDTVALGADLVSLSSHKLHGPKGVGALWVRRGLDVAALLRGGHQEREQRPGTENVPGIVGFGRACALAALDLAARAERIGRLRDALEDAALRIPGARRFGARTPRTPNTASLGFAGVPGELLMISLDLEGVAVATGAACSSGSLEASPVIRALGVSDDEAATAVRFSLGPDNTTEEIDHVAALLPRLVERVRARNRA